MERPRRVRTFCSVRNAAGLLQWRGAACSDTQTDVLIISLCHMPQLAAEPPLSPVANVFFSV